MHANVPIPAAATAIAMPVKNIIAGMVQGQIAEKTALTERRKRNPEVTLAVILVLAERNWQNSSL